MKRITVLLLLVLGCASAPLADKPPLKVMTFNIRLNIASDAQNAWPHRKDAVAALIRDHGVDLLGVQEALPEQLADLDARLPHLSRFGEGRSAERSGEYSAIFYRTDRFELLEHDTFWLSETPEVAGSKGWDGAYERIVTWGRLRDLRTGTVLYYFNTHFDHVGKQARRESARLLVRRVGEIAGQAPIIVTGDFNDVVGSEAWVTMTEAGFRDAMTSSRSPHKGPDSTWNAFRAIVPGRRIDFILVRGGIDVLEHAILPDTIDGTRFPSDHLPVLAEVLAGD